MKKLLIMFSALLFLSGCARVQTGEVGLRVNFDKTIEPDERLPGSWSQVVWGDLLIFKVQDVGVDVMDIKPIAADTASLQDFDATAIYSVSPSAVNELWTKKNKGFHAYDSNSNDILLMHNYVKQLLRNAAYKSVREYPSLALADNRQEMEVKMRETMNSALKDEGIGESVNISQIMIRAITPAQSILDSANALVTAENEFKKKEVEVRTAGEEAKRIAALNSNAKAIEYMNAQANMKIAEGVAEGKVRAIVIPYDFKGIVNIGNTP